MAQQLKSAPFTITRNTTGVTFVANDFATSSSWTTILTYAVPVGISVEILPTNYFFGVYASTSTTTLITAGSTRMVKANANGSDTKELFMGLNGLFLTIGNVLERPTLKVGVMLNTSEQLIVQVANLGTTLDVSASDFNIEATQHYFAI